MFSKRRPIEEAAILKRTLKMKSIKLNLFLKNIHNHTNLTNLTFVCYANNHFMEVFYEYCALFRHYWEKINIHRELHVVMSQPH